MATPNRTTQRASYSKPASQPLGRRTKAAIPEMLTETEDQKPFGRLNIYLMCGCVAMIIVGFLLMLGSGSSVENGFNPDIFSTRRIAVGPAITFLGFLLMAFAIIIKPRAAKRAKNQQDGVA